MTGAAPFALIFFWFMSGFSIFICHRRLRSVASDALRL